MIYQKPEEEIIVPEEEILKNINTPLKKLLPTGFLRELDPNFRFFTKLIKENLREENYEIMAITGYAGYGKSQIGAIIGCLIDPNYTYKENINFIPTAKEIENDYLKLPKYSFLHIDEASRSIHKHKWYEKTQQKLATLYDTERENHYVCSCLIMPRFQNFTENFRNFFIKYWINIPTRGIAIVYKRDEDKDTKDPWNLDENFRLKLKSWRGKRIFERTIGDIIRVEQKTKNYWFYFQIPEIPKPVWAIYQYLKKNSRIQLKENEQEMELESYKDRLEKQKLEKWKNIIKYHNEGHTHQEVAILLNTSLATVNRCMKEIRAYHKLKGDVEGLRLKGGNIISDNNNNIYNQIDKDSSKVAEPRGIKVQKDKLEEEQWDTHGLIKKD